MYAERREIVNRYLAVEYPMTRPQPAF
jgi:hypothetical protein